MLVTEITIILLPETYRWEKNELEELANLVSSQEIDNTNNPFGFGIEERTFSGKDYYVVNETYIPDINFDTTKLQFSPSPFKTQEWIGLKNTAFMY